MIWILLLAVAAAIAGLAALGWLSAAGAILLWTLGALAAALFLALVCPLWIYLDYKEGDLRVQLRLLGLIKLTLHPQPERPEKPPRRRRAKKEAPPPKEPKTPKEPVRHLMDLAGTLMDLLPHLGRSIGYTIRRVTLRRCRIQMTVGKEDAADTAIAVGRIYAVGYNLYALLCSQIKVKEFRFLVNPDYVNPGQKAQAQVAVSFRPSTLVVSGLLFAGRWIKGLVAAQLKKTGRRQKRRKGSGQNQQPPAQPHQQQATT